MPFPLLAALPAIGGAVSGLLGGAGKGAAQERLNQYQAQSDNYRTQQSAILNLLGLSEAATRDRADRAMTAPAARAKQALIAQMLGNYQAPSVSGLPAGVRIPQTGGGLASALGRSPIAKQALEALARQALEAQLSGSDVPAMPDTSRAMVAPPQLARPGKFESFMSGAGLIGGLLGAFGGMGGGPSAAAKRAAAPWASPGDWR